MRARIEGTQFAATRDRNYLSRARDAADAALRLSTVGSSLPWCELDALQAHVIMDEAEGVDNGWRQKAHVLSSKLVPPGLYPDPLIAADWGTH
jgi:hypothetical protein